MHENFTQKCWINEKTRKVKRQSDQVFNVLLITSHTHSFLSNTESISKSHKNILSHLYKQGFLLQKTAQGQTEYAAAEKVLQITREFVDHWANCGHFHLQPLVANLTFCSRKNKYIITPEKSQCHHTWNTKVDFLKFMESRGSMWMFNVHHV